MTWPPLPPTLQGVQGPIRVSRVNRIDGTDPDDVGGWFSARREIQVLIDLPDSVAWSILWHEWTHAALDDTGVCHQLDEDQQEGVCTAMSAAKLAMGATQ